MLSTLLNLLKPPSKPTSAMFKHYFERIADQVSIYPLFSLVVFFGFFIGLLAWAYWAKPSYLDHMASLPVEEENQ